jgi:Spy/CpxP family protein refolding chaperone
MKKTIALAAAAILALAVSACATQPHTDAAMLSGSHPMAPKAGVMSDKAMPSRSFDCTTMALDKMPPEHRAQCEKTQPQTPTP